MQLSIQQRQSIINTALSQLRIKAYGDEVMGKTWNKIGNLALAKQCAEGLTETTMAIASLEEELKNLE